MMFRQSLICFLTRFSDVFFMTMFVRSRLDIFPSELFPAVISLVEYLTEKVVFYYRDQIYLFLKNRLEIGVLWRESSVALDTEEALHVFVD